MVDDSVGGLITTLAADALIFLVIMFLFVILRGSKSVPLPEEYSEHKINRSYINSKEPLLAHIQHVRSVKNQEIKENIGSQPVVYLEFLRNVLYGFVVIGVLGLGILVPLYSLGTASVSTDLDKVGISHAITDANILAASIIMIGVNTLIIYSIAFRYGKRSLAQEINVKCKTAL